MARDDRDRDVRPADETPGTPPEFADRGYNTKDVAALREEAPPRPGFARRHWGKLTLVGLLIVPVLVIGIWTAIALGYSYSKGTRVGYVQKLSEKGWVCKTWEGELAMVNIPGSMSEKFFFSVRSDSVAAAINAAEGRRVELQYEEHRGIPTSCLGETDYFVTGVRQVQ